MDNEIMVPETQTTEVGFVNKGDIKRYSLTGKQLEAASGIKANRYVGFIQLVQKASKLVDKGFTPGTYVYKKSGQDDPIDLGKDFPAQVLAIRAKSTYYDGEFMNTEFVTIDEATEQPKITPRYEEFKAAAEACRGQNEAKYKAGYEVLLWLPERNCFATYFANTPSQAAAVDESISPYTGDPVTFLSLQRQNKKGTFYLPGCNPVTLDDMVDQEGNVCLPDRERTMDAIRNFNNPPRREENTDENVEGAKKVEGSKRVR
jgi:hypothetical protein